MDDDPAPLRLGGYDDALSRFAAAESRPVQGWREPVILMLLQDHAAARQQATTAPPSRATEAALAQTNVSFQGRAAVTQRAGEVAVYRGDRL